MAYEDEYNGDHINAYPNPYEASNMSAGANEYENVQTSYPYHSRDGLNMPRPQTPTVVPRPYGYEYPPTPRAPQPNQTTNGHVHDGANCTANNTEPTNYLSPEVLSQITAQVIQQLKTTGLDNLSNPGAPSQPEQSSRKTDLRSPLGPNAVRGALLLRLTRDWTRPITNSLPLRMMRMRCAPARYPRDPLVLDGLLATKASGAI